MSGEGLKACPTCRAAHAMLDHYAAPTHDNCGAPMVLADRIEAKIYADDLNASTRPTPTIEGGELVERLRVMASTGGRITCMAEYFGGAVMPSNLIAARLCADAADALASRDAEEDEAYEVGKRDGYEEAVSDIDRLTGGNGEYFASPFAGEGCPDPDAMKARILERFASRDAEIERLKGELAETRGWAEGWRSAVDTACTLLGLNNGLGASEFTVRVQRLSAALGEAERALKTALYYWQGWCQDEAEEDGGEFTGCSEEQHIAAKNLGDYTRAAISTLKTAREGNNA